MAVKSRDYTSRTRTVSIKGAEEDGLITVAELLEFVDQVKAAGVPATTRVKAIRDWNGHVSSMSVRSVEQRPTQRADKAF